MLVDTYEGLIAFCERASTSPVLAVDTEFLRERTFYPKLCLVQVGTEDEQAAVDVLSIRDLEPLERLLFNDVATKVLHACTQDVEVLLHRFGQVLRPVFDTQLAAAFLGHRMQMGYGALVAAYTGVHLDKADTLTDWSRRPLDESQLVYAEEDVRYLPGIYRQMMDELVRLDRLTWVLPEMADLVAHAAHAVDPVDAYEHVKRAGTLSRPQLAVCRELAAWREKAAMRKDIPRKWVISDEVLIELCRRAPKTPDRLRKVRGTQALSETDVEGALLAIKRGRACPPTALPTLARASKAPVDGASVQDQESVVDLMYAMVRLLADRAKVAPQLVAKRDDLVDFIHDPAGSRLSEGWRRTLVGEELERLLRGEAGLTVRNGRLEVI